MLTQLFPKKEMDLAAFRADFPLFQRRIKNKPIIYFDNACMPLRPRQVVEKSNEYYYNFPGCAGRSNHKIAEEVEQAVHEARTEIAKFFGAEEKAVVFTKNCTEAINLVANSFPFQSGDVVLTTDKEHNSNLLPWLKLQKQGLIRHEHVDSTTTNEFSLEALERKLKEHNGKVKLVSMVFTSNLDGVTNPVKEIITMAHKYKAKVLLDCAQAVVSHEVKLKKLGADYMTVSAHKMLGPNGIGALISTSENLKLLNQFIVGGETVKDSNLDGSYVMEDIPERFEAGLQNYPGIIGLGEAVKYLERVGVENVHKQLVKLNQYVTDGLKDVPQICVLGPPEAAKRSGVFSFVLKGKKVHEVSLLLNNLHNIMVRSGAHCVHSWFNKPENKSSVFKDGTVRASFGFYNTLEEADVLVKAVKEIAKL
ncbi:aminotransferase class V-fold PLP-dependent enzyme [Candidatus Woesearchaeota archaeon]|nr:aminotransferase class V-fold PLP-dependent enzyme [Candidatus Woesearchaeota archaeon]